MNTKEIGNRSEINVMKYLIEAGHTISLPFGENCRYDLILDDGDKLYRVQIKTARFKETHLIVPLRSTKSNKTSNTYRNYKDEVDLIIAYCHKLDKLYKFLPEIIDDNVQLVLRLEPTKNNQEKLVRWAIDYEM
jgi:hypothetical protein